MNEPEFYPDDYPQARRRFLEAASRAGAELEHHSIRCTGHAEGDLTIDVALTGPRDADRTVVITSGVHGVEGFFGSAIQSSWLSGCADRRGSPPDARVVLVHAVNPFGFMWTRRTNENNVDLNRNFLFRDADYRGAPNGYAALHGFLNPFSAPSSWEPYVPRAMWNVLRHGLPALKNAVAGGQYEYPQGLFFGGHAIAESARIVCERFPEWIGSAETVIHVDLHSGLGEYGQYRLLLLEAEPSDRVEWYRETFGSDAVEPATGSGGTAYAAKGGLGDFLSKSLDGCDYRFAVAEFGTYSAIRVLGALRAENRAHHYCPPSDPRLARAKLELRECFCPADPEWRVETLHAGTRIVQQAAEAREPGSPPAPGS